MHKGRHEASQLTVLGAKHNCHLPLRISRHTLRTNFQKPASQYTSQQRKLAKRKQNSENPTSQQAIKPIRILQSQQTSNQTHDAMPPVAKCQKPAEEASLADPS